MGDHRGGHPAAPRLPPGSPPTTGKILTCTRRRAPNRDLDAVENIVIDAIAELAGTPYRDRGRGGGRRIRRQGPFQVLLPQPQVDRRQSAVETRGRHGPSVRDRERCQRRGLGERRFGGGRGASDMK